MFKKLYILLISVLLISCGTGVSKKNPEGWINKDTFRVMGMGSPSDTIQKRSDFKTSRRVGCKK